MNIIPIVLFVIGLFLLIKGGDWFVDGATGIAHRFHVPELLIGATVVSIGTTLPEVMVSATSAVSGHGEIAYGNAIGSVICNTALIAALTIAIRPSEVDRKTLTVPVAFFFVAAAFYALIAYTSGNFTRIAGLAIVAMFALYIGINVKQALGAAQGKDTSSPNGTSLVKDIFLLVAGAVIIAIGANLLIDNGIIIARVMGVPESVIGLTFVALGTSLPELVTAVTSLAKGHGLLSLGNIVGSNLLNLVLVSGVSVLLAPFKIPSSKMIAGINSSLAVDIPVMFFVMGCLCIPALIRGKLSRSQGIILLLTYAAFCVYQFAM